MIFEKINNPITFVKKALAAQSASRCRGSTRGQLEWVPLDTQFALLQRLVQQDERQARPLVAKRCQALAALIRLTSIAPCQGCWTYRRE
ncbi:hypothetical protein VZT92_001242 [Zoarces viviparus]|uniref:Uncharacterized protein n=1 Tax=Zoarces viviparus TaxID=48416 RepID=A0AAW1G232_ZOAVI